MKDHFKVWMNECSLRRSLAKKHNSTSITELWYTALYVQRIAMDIADRGLCHSTTGRSLARSQSLELQESPQTPTLTLGGVPAYLRHCTGVDISKTLYPSVLNPLSKAASSFYWFEMIFHCGIHKNPSWFTQQSVQGVTGNIDTSSTCDLFAVVNTM